VAPMKISQKITRDFLSAQNAARKSSLGTVCEAISAYNAFKGSKASMRRAIGTTDTRPPRTARPPA
jgi:hypothetical protein